MISKRKNIFISLLLFTLYIFTFLLSELTVNARCEAVFGAEYVIIVYSLGIICTSVGYICFYLSRKLFIGEKSRRLIICVVVAGYIATTLCFMFASSKPLFAVSSLSALLLFGYVGGFAHYAISLFLFKKNYSGKVIGFSIALATLLQFIVQNLLITNAALIISLFLGVSGIVYLALHPIKDWMFENPLPYSKEPTVKAKSLALPVLVVAVMSVCFGLGDGLVTRLHASGVIDLTSYERLLYALGVIIAGIVADIRNRRFLPLCTLFMLVLSSAMTLFIGNDSAANDAYVSVMYLFSGFYVMYLTVTFIDSAPKTDKPDLWAGIGRVVRGVFIGLTALFSNALFESIGIAGISIAGICLSLVVLVLFVIGGGLNIRTEKNEPPLDRMKQFLEEYSLTPREADVLIKLVENENTNADIARELYISVRVAERYITSIYEKTGTRTRVGLVKLYYNK